MSDNNTNLLNNTKSNLVEKTVEKWHRLFLKLHATQEALNAYVYPPNRELTNVIMGPPSWLDTIDKASWNHQLRITLRKCILCIQLPAQKAKLKSLWRVLNNTIINSKSKAEAEQVGHRINRGLRRGVGRLLEKYTNNNKNINERAVRRKIKGNLEATVPPPPPQLQSFPASAPTIINVSSPKEIPNAAEGETTTDAPPCRELLRGEDFTPLRNYFEIYKAITPSKDLAAIIAFGIFGTKKKAVFLYRSLYKYMKWYETTERLLFKPSHYTSRKGEKKYTNNWGNWKEVVQKGKCSLTRTQIQVVARLYQLQIRFFRQGTEKGLKYICVDQTDYLQHRVLNILEIEKDVWTMLQGTTVPVLKFDRVEGKYDVDFYLAGYGVAKKREIQGSNGAIAIEIKQKALDSEVERQDCPETFSSGNLQKEVEQSLAPSLSSSVLTQFPLNPFSSSSFSSSSFSFSFSSSPSSSFSSSSISSPLSSPPSFCSSLHPLPLPLTSLPSHSSSLSPFPSYSPSTLGVAPPPLLSSSTPYALLTSSSFSFAPLHPPAQSFSSTFKSLAPSLSLSSLSSLSSSFLSSSSSLTLISSHLPSFSPLSPSSSLSPTFLPPSPSSVPPPPLSSFFSCVPDSSSHPFIASSSSYLLSPVPIGRELELERIRKEEIEVVSVQDKDKELVKLVPSELPLLSLSPPFPSPSPLFALSTSSSSYSVAKMQEGPEKVSSRYLQKAVKQPLAPSPSPSSSLPPFLSTLFPLNPLSSSSLPPLVSSSSFSSSFLPFPFPPFPPPPPLPFVLSSSFSSSPLSSFPPFSSPLHPLPPTSTPLLSLSPSTSGLGPPPLLSSSTHYATSVSPSLSLAALHPPALSFSPTSRPLTLSPFSSLSYPPLSSPPPLLSPLSPPSPLLPFFSLSPALSSSLSLFPVPSSGSSPPSSCISSFARDRLQPDASSSNLLPPAPIERKLGEERKGKEEIEVVSVREKDKEIECLLPAELPPLRLSPPSSLPPDSSSSPSFSRSPGSFSFSSYSSPSSFSPISYYSRDRFSSDTSSSNLLSPVAIERKLEAERKREEEIANVREEDKEKESVFPAEQIITKPRKLRVNKREIEGVTVREKDKEIERLPPAELPPLLLSPPSSLPPVSSSSPFFSLSPVSVSFSSSSSPSSPSSFSPISYSSRDRLLSDTSSSNLLSPVAIERKLEAERKREEEIEIANVREEDKEIESLFPAELIVMKPRKIRVNKREVWQKWRNKIRNKNKIALRKYAAEVAREERRKESYKTVFDYTTIRLTESEIDILSKGETFCPTTHTVDLDRLKTDIYYFNRKLRLHEQFKDKQTAEKDAEQRRGRNTINTGRISIRTVRGSINRANTHTPTTSNSKDNTHKQRHLPSTYDPFTQNRNLNRYTTCIQEDCLLAVKSEINIKDNIHKQHRIALKSLKQKIESKDIMITKADKGSGIVVCDYDIYVKKGTKYIEEEASAYSKVEDTETELVSKLVRQRDKVVEKLRKECVIPLQTATYCTKQIEEKITGMKFYFKIHKDQNVETTPVRPLQSCISAPTHHLSLVLTDILQPLLNTKHIPSFIYDSNHLLFRLQTLGAIPSNCTIISSDVSALYPSIPHQQGLEAMQSFLGKHTQYNKTQIESLMQALKLVISQNYVMWNNTIYKQTSGVAMGTPVAVAYANIFMAWVDDKVRQKAQYIHEHIRFIDDNLFIIPEEKIDDLMQLANNILPSIKYTHERLDKNSITGLAFLDTQLFITEQGLIEARLYTKPTDRHAYLLPSSYHPPHIVRNIPAAVFKRLKRLCSRKDWFLEDAEKAKGWLQNRGYKPREVDKALDTVTKLDRWDMIVNIEVNRGVAKTSVEDIYRIPFIVTYNKHAKALKQVLTKRQDLLNSSYKHSKVQPRITFRRQRNLDDLLIQKALRGPIRKIDREEFKFVKCGEKQQYRGVCPCKVQHEPGVCRCCAHAVLQPIDSKGKLNKKVDCNTKNVVYLIGCKKCSKYYIGETQQSVRDRLAQHLSNIAKLNQPLYLHFRLVHPPKYLFITILETVKNVEPFFRKVREAWWINHLQTLEPKGFNAKLDCNQIYQESLN